MNNRESVNVDLVRRVRHAAEELRYRPSNVARSLSLGRTLTVAVVVPDLGNPMFQGIIRGLTEAAGLEGYRVMVIETDEDPSAEPTVARESRARCDAVVLVSPASTDAVLADLVAELQPAVVLGRSVAGSASAALAIDFATGVELLVDHLTGLGHRDLVYLNGPPASPGNLARLVGFGRVEASFPNLRIAHLTCGSRMENGYAAAERVLAGQASAVIAYNDLVAFGLLARLNETGVAVPQDISVVGLDDIALAAFAVPPLTTLSVPEAELGGRAWRHLRARIAGRTPPAERSFEPVLVERASTGPIAPRKSARRRGSRQIFSLAWHSEDSADVLMGDGLPLLRYERGEQMTRVHAPRPYAHPIHTLAGVPLTVAQPRDHRHQYGLSVALPDVNGTSYWGGRTFLKGRGATLLANHGRQRVLERTSSPQDRDTAAAVLRERLVWEDEYGDSWLTEDRAITGRLLPELNAWHLDWRSELHADEHEITFASPASNGRFGAGYGGIFWRFDASPISAMFSELGSGEAGVHGRTTPWVALVRGGPQGPTTVILRQPVGRADGAVLPWFCRASDYTGLGPAVAWNQERVLPYGESMLLALDAVILDRAVRPDEVESVLAAYP
jgi:LacI family transcriptional regulator